VRVEQVVVAHNAVHDEDDPSTRDVLDQVAAVCAGLAALGLPHTTAPVVDGRIVEVVAPARGLVVFNLVESPPGQPYQQVAAAAALERLGVPFTGSSAAVIERTTDKQATRAQLVADGLAVAAGGVLDLARPTVLDEAPPPWILKPACEDASLGLDGPLLCHDREDALAHGERLAARFPGQAILVEHFLPGREFNLSLLEADGGVTVLPVAELEYIDFPESMPRILGFEAKWDYDSFAYTHTVRRFLGDDEAALAARLAAVALRAWELTGVRGYARVDLRLDEKGLPCVLELNANPCLAADAGFMAAAAAGGLSTGDVVDSIVQSAITEHR
jgi:D-alanine-D-alanine ligase